MALEPSFGVPEPGRLFCPMAPQGFQACVSRTMEALHSCMGSPFIASELLALEEGVQGFSMYQGRC